MGSEQRPENNVPRRLVTGTASSRAPSTTDSLGVDEPPSSLTSSPTMDVAERVYRTPGDDIAFNCPRCGVNDGRARIVEYYDESKLFLWIPFDCGPWNRINYHARFSTITCKSCRRKRRIPVGLYEIARLKPERLTQYFDEAVTIPIKLCIIISIVLFIVPFVSWLIALVGVLGTRRSTPGWRLAAWAGFWLSSIVPFIALAGFIKRMIDSLS